MTVRVYGKPVVLTAETIQKTRQWYADNHNACADEQLKPASERKWSVASHVDVEAYAAKERDRAAQSLAGDGDHTLAFVQMAVYIQTGESVPLLS